MKLADTSCSRLKILVAVPRATRKNDQLIMTIISKPAANPNKGDSTMASRTDRNPPSLIVVQPP